MLTSRSGVRRSYIQKFQARLHYEGSLMEMVSHLYRAGLFPLPPTRPASVAPLCSMKIARARRGASIMALRVTRQSKRTSRRSPGLPHPSQCTSAHTRPGRRPQVHAKVQPSPSKPPDGLSPGRGRGLAGGRAGSPGYLRSTRSVVSPGHLRSTRPCRSYGELRMATERRKYSRSRASA